MLTRIDELKERLLKLQGIEKDVDCKDVDHVHEYELLVIDFFDFFYNVPRQHFRGELELCLLQFTNMKKASKDLRWLQENFTFTYLREVTRQEEEKKVILGITEEATLDFLRLVGQGSPEAAKFFLDAILEHNDIFDEIQIRAFKRRLFGAINRNKQTERCGKMGLENNHPSRANSQLCKATK